MPITPVPAVTLTPVAHFPEHYFLENLAVRADGSVLVTAVLQKELWCVPGPEPRVEVEPAGRADCLQSSNQKVSELIEAVHLPRPINA